MTQKEAKALGLFTYTPDKPCHQGHSLRYTSNKMCIQCHQIYKSAHYDAQAQHGYYVKWKKNNPNYMKENSKKWYATTRGQIMMALHRAKDRCKPDNPYKVHNFRNYGGKGVQFLITDWEEAVRYMTPKWDELRAQGIKPSIDRIDSNGHYELSNIQVISLSENCAKANRARAEKRRKEREAAQANDAGRAGRGTGKTDDAPVGDSGPERTE